MKGSIVAIVLWIALIASRVRVHMNEEDDKNRGLYKEYTNKVIRYQILYEDLNNIFYPGENHKTYSRDEWNKLYDKIGKHHPDMKAYQDTIQYYKHLRDSLHLLINRPK